MEFTKEQKRYIVEREDDFTLSEFAKKFNCTANDVYEVYSEMLKTGEHWEYYKPQYEILKRRLEGTQFEPKREKIEGEAGCTTIADNEPI